ncbi:MAG: OmpA family protein [Elusimicrobiota bacterium]
MRKTAEWMCLAAVVVAAFVPPALSQQGSFQGSDAPSSDTAGLSPEMQKAIRSYQKGQDLSAMDGFMEILTNGDPSERSMANDYLNLLTHRMDLEAQGKTPPMPRKAYVPVPQNPQAPLAQNYSAPKNPKTSVISKAAMEREIHVKIQSIADKNLKIVQAAKGVVVIMGSNGKPAAIGIPTARFFGSGTEFRKKAEPLVDALTKMVFALGGAQVAILPQGAPLGDAKILDMRRAMAISSAFFSAGIAPSRVNVNLLDSQLSVPQLLGDFTGAILIFSYDRPLNLSAGADIGVEEGPPISLGIDPDTFRMDSGEGTIIEFSVEEPPAGIASWEFQLLEPKQTQGAENLVPIEQVTGDGSVFHQIYWNGHRHYFGAAVPVGRYECVLIATDGKNRRRVLHRWISVLPPRAVQADVFSPPQAASVLPKIAPSPDWPLGGRPKAASLISRRSRLSWMQINKKKKSRVKRVPKRRSRNRKKKTIRGRGKVHPKAASSAKPKAKHYEFTFGQNDYNLDSASESLLGQIAKQAAANPSFTISVTGYADPSQPGAGQLALNRGRLIANLLINRYGLDPSRLQVSSSVAAGSGPKAAIDFLKLK